MMEKVAPQIEKKSEEKLTRIKKLLLKFDNNKQEVKFVGKCKTIPYCGDSSVSNNFVRKQVAQKQGIQEGDVREEEVHGTEVQKQEDLDHGFGMITAAQATFSSKENSQNHLQRLLSQQLVSTPGQLQQSVDMFCDLPMERTDCDDITE